MPSSSLFHSGSFELSITASLGVVSLEPTACDIHALLRRAHAALYAAKANGRNRTMMLTTADFATANESDA